MTGVFPKKGLGRREHQSVRSSDREGWSTGQAQGMLSHGAAPRSMIGIIFFLPPVVRSKWGVSYCASSPAANDGRLAYGRALEAN